MKLIDILVEELPKRGGWPEKVTHIGQDYDRELMFYGRGNVRTGIILDQLADDHRKHGETGVKITREQYEAALAAKNDGWIEWGGGECPVDAGKMVDVIFGYGGRKSTNIADCWRWNHNGTDSDIIAYRLRQPQEVAQTEAEQEADLNDCIGQTPATVWNGEGLPPVGCECEVSVDGGRSWCTYRAINEKNGARLIEIGNFTEEFQNNNWIFRPTRSEAERKRDDICDKIYGAMTNAKRKDNRSDMAEEIYDAIAAGKIPGVKLED